MIRVEEGKIRSHVDEVVRETVEETLNGLLEAEADDLCGAKRYGGRRSGWTRGPALRAEACRPRRAR